jgi:signal peptidase I
MLSCNMAPTLLPGYHITVEAAKGKVRRADIVYFLPPEGTRRSADDIRVSRVVGVPGDDIEMRNNTVYVNGSPANEPYLPAGTRQFPFKAQHLGPDAYFVMGDNRVNSADSRGYGPVKAADIRYRATKVTKGKPAADDPDCFSGPGAPPH